MMGVKNWYTAVLVVTTEIVGAENYEPLTDLQWRLVQASDRDDALTKALALGREAETSYENVDGDLVQWKFLGVHELVELDGEPADGTEVFSRLTRDEPGTLVEEREQLEVFTVDKLGSKTAREVLDDLEAKPNPTE